MAKKQISAEEKKAQRKAYWANVRAGVADGFYESLNVATKASIATSSVLITIMAVHLLSGRKLIPAWGPKE